MNKWTDEFVELISQTMIKFGNDGVPITCAKLIALMGLDKEDEDEVRLCVRKKLDHLIVTKLGPGGGYVLKNAVVTKKVGNDLLATDIRDKINAALKAGKKISVMELQMELGCTKRSEITDLLVEMKEFKLVKGVGITYATTADKFVSKMTAERIAQLESKAAFVDDSPINS